MYICPVVPLQLTAYYKHAKGDKVFWVPLSKLEKCKLNSANSGQLHQFYLSLSRKYRGNGVWFH